MTRRSSRWYSAPREILASPTRPIHVSMSTISLALAERLTAAHAEAEGFYVSAPVFGRPAAAETGKLFVVAAGPAEALSVCAPLFDAIGQRTFLVGDAPKAANLIKLCGNYMIMAAIESLAEAMTLAAKSGVEKATLLDVLTNTLFNAPIYKTYGEILLKEQFEPAGFAAPLGSEGHEPCRCGGAGRPGLDADPRHIARAIADRHRPAR